VLLALVPAGPTTVPLPGVTVLPVADRQVSLVVDIAGGTRPLPPEAVSVDVAGTRQPAMFVPVMSDQLAASVVVDVSQAGGAGLASWLSGAARFVLDAPAGARTAVVADTTPPAVLARSPDGPVDIVRALSGVQPHGARDTSDALALAVRELAATPAAPRVVILYTGAADAGDVASGDLAARLAREHVLLVVVSTAAATRYWTEATRPTGGFLAPAGAATVPAFDQVATTLRDRYLVTFPAPAQLPARASVRVDLPQVAMATDVVIPAADAPPDRGSGGGWLTVAVWVAVLVAAALLLIGSALRLR